MNECLVTKLKGVVDNDNLERLGEIIFKNTTDSQVTDRFKNTASVVVRIISGTASTDHQLVDGETITAGDHWLFIAANSAVGFTPKYDLTEIRDLGSFGSDISKYAYISGLTYLYTSAGGDYSVLKDYALTNFISIADPSTPNINVFEGLAGSKNSLTDLGFYDRDNNVLTTSQLAQFVNLTNALLLGNSCTGTMEDYFSIIRPNKPSGSITISYGNGITYQGRDLVTWRTVEGQGATKIRFTWSVESGIVIDYPA